jgi:hypothetical protein
MKCLEFRRQLTQDPYQANDVLTEHATSCNTCSSFAQDLQTHEVRLRSILNNVMPPPELAAKIQFAVRLEQRKKRFRKAWYAMAASVLMFVGVSMTSLFNESRERGNMALAQSMLDHIEDEHSHLVDEGPASRGRIKFVFQRFGASLKEDIGPVNFVAECLMRERNGVHLVLPGKAGPVTAFYMPGEHIKESGAMSAGHYQGEIVATEWGSVAVLGEPGEPLQGKAKELASKVHWPGHQLVQRSASDAKIQLAQRF